VTTDEIAGEICYYPFIQLLLQPIGAVSPCCWNQGVLLGNVMEKPLSEIWNDEPVRKLRREFLEGNPVSCRHHMRHKRCHRATHGYSQEAILAETQAKGPSRLDVRLNGRCNLQCIMCDIWRQPNGVYDESEFWALGPTEIFPFLKEIDYSEASRSFRVTPSD
jgi:MoaA/NifB/PqqE/SkfB family radical SAM enzyme